MIRSLLSGACVLLALLSGCSRQPAQDAADLVILEGDIQTMDAAAAHATALAVRDGKIVYVGDDAGAKPRIGPKTQVVHAEGMTVLPGLIDSHIHAAEGALGLGGCSLSSSFQTAEQIRFPTRRESEIVIVLRPAIAGQVRGETARRTFSRLVKRGRRSTESCRW